MKAPKDHFIIQIDITNACGHRCSNCTRFCGHIKKPYFMQFDYFCRAVDSLLDHPGIIGVMGGEPTLHPEFDKMCQYLQETVGKRYPVVGGRSKYPTDRLVEERLKDQLTRYEIEEYEDGLRAIIKGTGLWTSVTRQYLRYYETIQDTFNWQNLNDHSNASFHQPILITYEEMGIADEEWKKLREKCWVNQEWSGSITPKGCFFCEVAGAFDMIYDGPGGLPLEDGWWRRPIEDYKDQFQWCEMCGIPLKTFSRDAREETDDISEYHVKRLEQSKNVVFGRKKMNHLKIHDGHIEREKTENKERYRGQTYIDDAHDRVNEDSPIYAKELFGVIVDDGECSIQEIERCLDHNSQFFKDISVLLKEREHDFCVQTYTYDKYNIFEKLKECFECFGDSKYIIAITPHIILSKNVDELKKCVINPGTLHYYDLSRHKYESNMYIDNSLYLDKGMCMLLNCNAKSWNKIQVEPGDVYHCFRQIGKNWDRNKIVSFSNEMSRSIYSQNGINEKRSRLLDCMQVVIRLTKTYGIARMAKFVISTIKRYGIKLTTEKIKGRVY